MGDGRLTNNLPCAYRCWPWEPDYSPRECRRLRLNGQTFSRPWRLVSRNLCWFLSQIFSLGKVCEKALFAPKIVGMFSQVSLVSLNLSLSLFLRNSASILVYKLDNNTCVICVFYINVGLTST